MAPSKFCLPTFLSIIFLVALKTVGYAGLFGGTVAAFGGIMYTLYTELQGESGTFPLVQRAVSLIEADTKVSLSAQKGTSFLPFRKVDG